MCLSRRIARTGASSLFVFCTVFASAARARDGDLDRSFGAQGVVELPFPGNLTTLESFIDVKLVAGGKILVAATVSTETDEYSDMGIMRLDSNGALDTTFAGIGARLVGFGTPGNYNDDGVRSLAIAADGRLVLVGESTAGSGNTDMAVARLHANGELDTSFGSGGKATVAFDFGATTPRRADRALKGIVLADGRVMISGTATTAAGSVMAVARLRSDGTLDADFDGDGRRILDFGGGPSDVALSYSLVPSATGQRVYVIGGATQAGNLNIAVARLLDNGSVDTSFAGDGTMTYAFDAGGAFGDTATDAIETPDGKLVVCGSAQVTIPNNNDVACIRLLPNGSVDGDFPPVLVPFDLDAEGTEQASAMQREANGRLVLAGLASNGARGFDAAVLRLLPSGQVDPSFGNDGRAHYDTAGPIGANRATALVLQPDGRIVVAGSVARDSGNGYEVQVLRLIGDTLHEDGFDGLTED